MKRRRSRRATHGMRGFSLLEAIVALTIFSVCALALYGWLSVNVNALARTDAQAVAIRDGHTALAVLRGVNPMSEPTGARELPGGLLVRWDGREIVARQPGKSPAGTPLIFDLALYELDVGVFRNGREVNRFAVRRAGWATSRSLQDANL